MGKRETVFVASVGKDTTASIRRLVFALLEKGKDLEALGHVWIEWAQDDKQQNEFRGFYPDMSAITDEAKKAIYNGTLTLRAYLLTYPSIPGYFSRDIYAQNYRNKSLPIDRNLEITEDEKIRLNLRCFIPKMKDSVCEGTYSLDENDIKSQNCSSWAIQVVNHIKNNPRFFVCSRPKRLKYVKQEIFEGSVSTS